MSELVEKVARAICRKSWNEDYLHADIRLEDIVDGSWGEYVEEARAAIAAVLEHLADNVNDEMSIAAVVDWQNDKGGGTLQEWLQSAISAALRAAAGSAPTTPEVK